MFTLFSKNPAKPDAELARLVAEERERKYMREERRQWAIEQANYSSACECSSIDEVLRAAKRFYLEAFGEEWDA